MRNEGARRRAEWDDTKEPAYIANVLRRGYRLVAMVVRCVHAPAVRASNPPAVPKPATPTPGPAVTTRPRSRLPAIVPVALIAALPLALFVATCWLSWRIALEHPPTTATITTGDKSIAVLAFAWLDRPTTGRISVSTKSKSLLEGLEPDPRYNA